MSLLKKIAMCYDFVCVTSLFSSSLLCATESFTVKQICEWASNKKFTHLFVISERLKKCNG